MLLHVEVNLGVDPVLDGNPSSTGSLNILLSSTFNKIIININCSKIITVYVQWLRECMGLEMNECIHSVESSLHSQILT